MFLQKSTSQSNFFSLIDQQHTSTVHSEGLREWELNEECFHRIKKQRQNVQELISINQELNKQLKSKNDQLQQIAQKLEAAEALSSYRQAYDQLTNEYENLYANHLLASEEHEAALTELKKEMGALLYELQQKKQSQKKLQENFIIAETQWKAHLSDKEQAFLKQERQYTKQIKQLTEELSKMSKKYKDLKQQYQSDRMSFKSCEKQARKQSKAKERQLQSTIKQLNRFQKECSRSRLKTVQKENQWECQRQKIKEDFISLNSVVSSLRKQLAHKMLQIESLKESLQKYDLRNKQLQEIIDSLKRQTKSTVNKNKLSSQQYSHEKQMRKKSDEELERLRRQNLKHIEDYNILQVQLHRWKCLAQKRQDSNRISRFIANSNRY